MPLLGESTISINRLYASKDRNSMGYTAKLFDRWVAGMDAATNARLLGYWGNDPDPLLQPFPHLFLGVLSTVRIRHLLRLIVVEGRCQCSATDYRWLRPPHVRRHPVIPEYRYTGGPDVADGLDHVFDLSFSVRAAHNDLLVKSERHVLDRHQTQTLVLDLNPHLYKIAHGPLAASIRDLRLGEQHVLYSVLRGKPQELGGRRIELSKSWSHFRSAFRNYPVSSELQVIHQLYGLHCCQ